MNELTQSKLENYAEKILNDYDTKNHSALFKIKISILVSQMPIKFNLY